MTTNPPPAYAAVSSGGEGQGAPPPAYNAVGAPPSYNPASGPSAPSFANPSAPAIQYVDQHGNPVQMPVQQAPVQPAANVQYVDQFGNPVAPPTANIRYVDQFGNPVAAPPQSANIQYVQAPPQQVAPQRIQYAATAQTAYVPSTASSVASAQTYPASATANQTAATTQSTGQKQGSSTSCVFGLLAVIAIVIGLILNSLSAVEVEWVTVHCGWSEIRTDIDYSGAGVEYTDTSDNSMYYDDLCEAETIVTSYTSYTTTNSPYGSPSWCSTQSAGTISLICCIISAVTALFGAISASILRRNSNGRGWFLLCMISGIIGIVIWLTMDEMCHGSDGLYSMAGYDMELGGSMICQIIGAALAMVAAATAK
eukprot:327244_1